MAEAGTLTAVGLQCIQTDDLRELARGRVPPGVRGRHATGSLPPDFVAVRALKLQHEAASCSDALGVAGALYYIVQDDHVVGSCGFKDAARDGWVEIGYGVGSDYQRKGLGARAVAALCTLAFESGRIRWVRACIEPDNAGSNALALSLGFVPGHPVIEEDGSLLIVWTLACQPPDDCQPEQADQE